MHSLGAPNLHVGFVQTLFTTRFPDIRSDGLQTLARVLDRQLPPQSEIDIRLAELYAFSHQIHTNSLLRGLYSNRSHRTHGHDDIGEDSYAAAPLVSRPWSGSAEFYTPALQSESHVCIRSILDIQGYFCSWQYEACFSVL